MPCEHTNFKVVAEVARLTEKEGGPVVAYGAAIRVFCTDCNVPFRFVGVDPGYHFTQPRVSIDGEELRAPLEPAYVKEVLGIPERSGHA